jgi:hypothetical protein
MKRLTFLIALLVLMQHIAHAKLNYTAKVEFGYLYCRYRTVSVSPGPNWKGYNLPTEPNGINTNIVGGLNFKNRLFTGLGLGYLNFEGISGISAFTDIEYLVLKTRLAPLVNLRVGYNHVWNQYEGGSGTASGELALGLSYRVAGKYRVYIQAGALNTQQLHFVSTRIGFRIN